MADEDAKKEKGGKKKLIMIAVPVLVVGVAAGFLLGGRGGSADAATETTTTTSVPTEGPVVEVDTMTVNIGGDGTRYARLGFAVVLNAEATPETVAEKIPLLQDAAIRIMAGFTAEELVTTDGQDRLREALTEEAVALFPDGEVLRAVLTELIVQ